MRTAILCKTQTHVGGREQYGEQRFNNLLIKRCPYFFDLCGVFVRG